MGWAFGIAEDGREIGYGVEAVCDKPDCDEKIDRGLAYLCGDVQTVGATYPEYGCAKYFCLQHIYVNNRCYECNEKEDYLEDEDVGG